MDWSVKLDKTWNHRIEASFDCEIASIKKAGGHDAVFAKYWEMVGRELPLFTFGRDWNVIRCDTELDYGQFSTLLWDRDWEKGDYLGSRVTLQLLELYEEVEVIELDEESDPLGYEFETRIAQVTQPYLEALLRTAHQSPTLHQLGSGTEIWVVEHDESTPLVVTRV